MPLTKLKFFRNTCRKIAQRIETPKDKFSNICIHCGLPWTDIDYELKLRHRQVSLHSAKTKKLLYKLEKSKETPGSGLLKHNEMKRAKWLQKRINNRMEILCKHCNKKTFIEMKKPKAKEQATSLQQNKATLVEDVQRTKRKKKKSKNKTAGLKLAANDNNKVKSEMLISKVCSTNPFKTASDAPTLNRLQKKKKNATNKTAVTATPSKTQQNNSILQLASLLRQQSSNSSKNSTQSKLEAFFK